MLHAKLFACIFKFIDAALHFLQVGIYLRPILIVDVYNFDQTFLQHQSLLLRLNSRVIQTAALFDAFASTVTTDSDSDIAACSLNRRVAVIGVPAL